MRKLGAIVILCCSILAAAQVRISVPEQHYKSRDKIDVQISNTGSEEITFCVEAGYISYIDSEHSEPSPTPIYVQQKGPHNWNTLLTGPDIGSLRSPEFLRPGESQHFPFRVNAHGTIRLVLDYRVGSDEQFCKNWKGTKISKSHQISIE